jgi:hypothetical protein
MKTRRAVMYVFAAQMLRLGPRLIHAMELRRDERNEAGQGQGARGQRARRPRAQP